MNNASSTMKLFKAAFHAVRIFQDPNRLDDVIALAESLLGERFSAGMLEAIRRDPESARSLEERPRVRGDLDKLSRLPEGTLGRAYSEFMKRNNLDPAALPNHEANDAFSFVKAHLPETHDIWHVITGFTPDALGEIGLQAFYMAQLATPLAPVIISLALMKTLGEPEQREQVMSKVVRGWELGQKARPLFGVRWGEMWEMPLAEVQARLQVTPVA